MFPAKRKIAFFTLGCKLNFAESSYISSLAPDNKYIKVTPDKEADIYVINTCTVTAEADRKCKQTIRKFINRNPEAIIAVVGCYSQLRAEEIASIPGVDIVLGAQDKFKIYNYLDKISGKLLEAEKVISDIKTSNIFIPSWSAGDRTRTFLKVQDGCDSRCSYCTVPLARGRSRNAGISSIIEEARKLAETGITELVITGVNIGDFGKTTGESFATLLRQIEKVEGIKRIRLSSIEPEHLNEEIISIVAQSHKIMPHFHIPVQSGSDRILSLMRRRYNRKLLEARITRIIDAIPLAGIGADIIVGFPSESDKDFEDTYSLVNDVPLSYLHVFPFSARPGTEAAGMEDKVRPDIITERRNKMKALGNLKNTSFKSRNINKTDEVLFENKVKDRMISGFTRNYLRAVHPFNENLKGQIKKVIITGINPSGNLTVKLSE